MSAELKWKVEDGNIAPAGPPVALLRRDRFEGRIRCGWLADGSVAFERGRHRYVGETVDEVLELIRRDFKVLTGEHEIEGVTAGKIREYDGGTRIFYPYALIERPRVVVPEPPATVTVIGWPPTAEDVQSIVEATASEPFPSPDHRALTIAFNPGDDRLVLLEPSGDDCTPQNDILLILDLDEGKVTAKTRHPSERNSTPALEWYGVIQTWRLPADTDAVALAAALLEGEPLHGTLSSLLDACAGVEVRNNGNPYAVWGEGIAQDDLDQAIDRAIEAVDTLADTTDHGGLWPAYEWLQDTGPSGWGIFDDQGRWPEGLTATTSDKSLAALVEYLETEARDDQSVKLYDTEEYLKETRRKLREEDDE